MLKCRMSPPFLREDLQTPTDDPSPSIIYLIPTTNNNHNHNIVLLGTTKEACCSTTDSLVTIMTKLTALLLGAQHLFSLASMGQAFFLSPHVSSSLSSRPQVRALGQQKLLDHLSVLPVLFAANSDSQSDDSEEKNKATNADDVLNGDVASTTTSSSSSDVLGDKNDAESKTNPVWDCTIPADPEEERIAALKKEIFQLGASYNRGFAASPKARKTTMRLIEELERCNKQEAAAEGVDGSTVTATTTTTTTTKSPPLEGSWRMLWTTGPDVLVLDANPLLTTCAIYQVFEPPMVTNVIDLQPKAQALLPPSTIGNTLLRARVITRANRRQGFPNRVGLVFERVQLQPLQFLGNSIDVFPPLGFDLPRFGAASMEPNNADSPGYFTVTYLDHDVLIYRQQFAGAFVFIKVDDMDP
eukprot:scaffold3973_cov161-Amphora_coffeaeformis.AAC.15